MAFDDHFKTPDLSAWEPVTPNSAAPTATQLTRPSAPFAQPGQNPFLRTTLPPSFGGASSDSLRQFYNPATVQNRLVSLPPAANPALSAIAKTVIQQTSTPDDDSAYLKFRGVWNSFTNYNINDIVLYDRSAYLAIKASTNVQPDTDQTTWVLLSENLVFNPSKVRKLTAGIGLFDQVSTATQGSAPNSPSVITVGPLIPASDGIGKIAIFAGDYSFFSGGNQNAIIAPPGYTNIVGPISYKILPPNSTSEGVVTNLPANGDVVHGTNSAAILTLFDFIGTGLSVVQTKTVSFANPAATGTLTFTSSVTAGNTILVALNGFFPTLTIADNQGNNYTVEALNASLTGGINAAITLAWAQVVNGGTLTIGMTVTPTNTSWSFSAAELSSTGLTGFYEPYQVWNFKGSTFVCLHQTLSDAFTDPVSWAQIAQGTGFVNALSGSYTITPSDFGRLIEE